MATIENFQEEHQRMMRALHTSIERETDLQRQLRRMKEQLVSVALRLQVAVKVAQNDERTTVELRRDCSEAKINAAIANKRADEAAEIIQALKIEISCLKRKVRELQTSDEELPDVSNAALHAIASAEVDKMSFNQANKVKFASNTGGHPERSTAFQQWKMQHFLWTPDTAAASQEHEKHTVDMMADAITAETLKGLNRFQYPIHSSVGKLKKRISENEGIPVISQKMKKQSELLERLALPTNRNPDRLVASVPDSMSTVGSRTSPNPPFTTSMRAIRSPKKSSTVSSKSKTNLSMSYEMDSAAGTSGLFLDNETQSLINAAYSWSMEQKSLDNANSNIGSNSIPPINNHHSRPSSTSSKGKKRKESGPAIMI